MPCADSLRNDIAYVLPPDALVRVEVAHSVFEMYQALAFAQRGLLTYSDRALHYVIDAAALFERLQQRDSRARNWSTPLLELIESAQLPAPSVLDPVPCSIDQAAKQWRTSMCAASERLYGLVAGNEPVGWLTRSAALMRGAQHRLAFLCAGQHENPDPDHGFCYRCARPIQRCAWRERTATPSIAPLCARDALRDRPET